MDELLDEVRSLGELGQAIFVLSCAIGKNWPLRFKRRDRILYGLDAKRNCHDGLVARTLGVKEVFLGLMRSPYFRWYNNNRSIMLKTFCILEFHGFYGDTLNAPIRICTQYKFATMSHHPTSSEDCEQDLCPFEIALRKDVDFAEAMLYLPSLRLRCKTINPLHEMQRFFSPLRVIDCCDEYHFNEENPTHLLHKFEAFIEDGHRLADGMKHLLSKANDDGTGLRLHHVEESEFKHNVMVLDAIRRVNAYRTQLPIVISELALYPRVISCLISTYILAP